MAPLFYDCRTSWHSERWRNLSITIFIVNKLCAKKVWNVTGRYDLSITLQLCCKQDLVVYNACTIIECYNDNLSIKLQLRCKEIVYKVLMVCYNCRWNLSIKLQLHCNKLCTKSAWNVRMVQPVNQAAVLLQTISCVQGYVWYATLIGASPVNQTAAAL